MKKATTVVMAPAFPSFAKRAKFGVAVPPETKEPTPNHPIGVKPVSYTHLTLPTIA